MGVAMDKMWDTNAGLKLWFTW